MRFVQFLKEKQHSIILHVLAILINSILLYLFNVSLSSIIILSLILLLFFFCTMGLEFYRMKNYYDELLDVFDHLKEKTYIADIVKEPSFYSGQVFYHVLKEAAKNMNDRISALKHDQRQYHDYIELWVHEIKTPITALKLLLANHQVPESFHIKSEVSKVEGYVEQALFYARSSTLNQDYKIETFTLEEAVNEAVKASSLSIIGAKGQIERENLHLKVASDPKWIIFMIKQVINNSIKYRRDPLRISFSTERVVNGTVLRIADNGIGISESDMERVFQRGFTGTNGRNYAKSTGMGLYLCKILCQKLGLLIKAESNQPNGIMIKIFFPDKLNILK
jgi:signal transduction histidine kinase